jgi:hypothetical protein
MLKRLAPSRTFTLAGSGVAAIGLVALGLMGSILFLLLGGCPDSSTLVPHLLGSLDTAMLTIAACSGVGAGAMSLRDSVSKGTTTSQAHRAKEGDGG